MSNYLQQLAGAAHRWRWELQVQSDPPVTYQLGTFSGDLVSLDFRTLPPIPEGVEFRLVAVPVAAERMESQKAGCRWCHGPYRNPDCPTHSLKRWSEFG